MEEERIRSEPGAVRKKKEGDKIRASEEVWRIQKEEVAAAAPAAQFQEGVGAGSRLGFYQAPPRHSPRIRKWGPRRNSIRNGAGVRKIGRNSTTRKAPAGIPTNLRNGHRAG